MIKFYLKSVLIAGSALLVLSSMAFAQNEEGRITFYKGIAVNDNVASGTNLEGVIVGSWGGGSCQVDDVLLYGDPEESIRTPTGTLKVTTNGYYEGARLDFNPPIDISTCFKTPFTYLRFSVKFPPASNSGYVASPVTNPNAPMQPMIRNIRVVLFLDSGDVLSCTPQMVDISKLGGAKGFAWMSLPFGAFKNIKAGGKIPMKAMLKRMILTGNTRDSFNIGEIRSQVDPDPITVETLEDQNVENYGALIFEGHGDSQVTPLKYSWDFDDKDGIQEEATGAVVSHRFTKPGTCKVTLTVSDPTGLKSSTTTSCSVEVND